MAIIGSTDPLVEGTSRQFFTSIGTEEGFTFAWSIAGDGTLSSFVTRDVIVTATSVDAEGGSFTLSVTVIDNRSAIPTTQVFTIVVSVTDNPQPNRPPTMTVLADQTTIKVGESTTVRATASDPDNDSLTYRWNHSGVGSANILSGITTQTTVLCSAGDTPGRLNIRCRVFDNRGGEANVLETIDVVANQVPTGEIRATTTSVGVGEQVGLTFVGQDPDGSDSALKYLWSAASGSFNVTLGVESASAGWIAPSTAGTYTVSLAVTDEDGGVANFSVSIKVTEAPPDPSSFTVSAGTSVPEGTTRNYTIKLDVPATSALDFAVSVVAASTTASSGDYSYSGSIRIPVGSQTGQGSFTATQDIIDDDDETVTLRISNSSVGSQDVTFTIVDDDEPNRPLTPESTIFVVPSIVAPGGLASFTFSGNDPDGISNYSWSVVDSEGDTAGKISDATPASGSQASSIGWTAPTKEGTYTIRLVITDRQNVASTLTASIQVKSNPVVSSITLAQPPNVIEGGSVPLGVLLNAAAPAGGLVINFRRISGTAALITDFTLTSVTINAGLSSGSGRFTSVEDTADEGDETAVIEAYTTVDGSEVTSNRRTITIVDDDGTANQPPTVTIAVQGHTDITQPVTVAVNGVITLTATANDPDGANSQITYRWNADGGTYNRTIGTTSSEARWSASTRGRYELTCTVTDEDSASTTSAVVVVLVGQQNTPTSISISSDDRVAPGSDITITFTLDQPAPTGGTQVTISKSGNAVEGTDYTLAGSVTISAGDLSASTTLSALAAATDGRSIIITITTSNPVLTSQQKTITIGKALDPTTLTLSASKQVAEGSSVTVTASLDHVAPTGGTIVNLTLRGTATRNTDYTIDQTRLTIPEGSTSAIAIISTLEDDEDDDNETIIISAASSNPVLSTDSSITITIVAQTDKITELTLRSLSGTVREGEDLSIDVVINNDAPDDGVVVDLTTAGTATVDTDYQLLQSQVTIPVGQRSVSILLRTIADIVADNNETVIINAVTKGLSTPELTATLTITISETFIDPIRGLGKFTCLVPEDIDLDLSSVVKKEVQFPEDVISYIERNGIDFTTHGRAIHENDNHEHIVIDRGEIRLTGILNISAIDDPDIALQLESWISVMSRTDRFSLLPLYRRSFGIGIVGSISTTEIRTSEDLIVHQLSAGDTENIRIGDYVRTLDAETRRNRLMQVVGIPTDIDSTRPNPVANRPPTLRVKATDASIFLGDSSTLTAEASDPDNNSLTYIWNHTGVGSITGSGSSITFNAGNIPGNANIRCTVHDGLGLHVTQLVKISVSQRPGNVSWSSGLNTPLRSGNREVFGGIDVRGNGNLLGIAGSRIYEHDGTSWTLRRTFPGLNGTGIAELRSTWYVVEDNSNFYWEISVNGGATSNAFGSDKRFVGVGSGDNRIYFVDQDEHAIYLRTSTRVIKLYDIPESYGTPTGIALSSERESAVLFGNSIRIRNRQGNWRDGPALPSPNSNGPFSGIAYDNTDKLVVVGKSNLIFREQQGMVIPTADDVDPPPVPNIPQPTPEEPVAEDVEYVTLSPNIALPKGSQLFLTETIRIRLMLDRIPELVRNADWYGPWEIHWIEIE